MKHVRYVLLIVGVIAAFSACTLHFPYDWDWEYTEYRVILKVEPDDAQVLLNGKWIGDAYEFSTWNSAIRLSSKNNELIVKKEGYVEEAIDLYEYNTQKIVIRLNLLKDKDYSRPARPYKQTEKVKPQDAERKPGDRSEPKETGKKPEYRPKTEPPKELPPMPPEEELSGTPIDIVLDIQPEEASVYLNGKFWGISPKNEKIENLRLKPGKYTLEVVKPGYTAYSKEINVNDQKIELVIKLEKK